MIRRALVAGDIGLFPSLGLNFPTTFSLTDLLCSIDFMMLLDH